MCNKFLDFPVYIFSGKIYLGNKKDYRITFLNLKSRESYSGLGLLGGSYCCRTKVVNFKKNYEGLHREGILHKDGHEPGECSSVHNVPTGFHNVLTPRPFLH